MEDCERESGKLAAMVASEMEPDLVAYLAKGSYLIGVDIASYFDVPLIELSVCRSGESKKRGMHTLLRLLPAKMRKLMRGMELKIRKRCEGAHAVAPRQVSLTGRYPFPSNAEKILLVDDSVDSGASVMGARRELLKKYPDASVKTAVFNVMSASCDGCQVDYALHHDCLLSTPASKDNRQYDLFLSLYESDRYYCGKSRSKINKTEGREEGVK